MILPPEQSSFFKEGGGEGNSVIAPSTARGKMVFALLDEVVAVHAGLTLVHVRGSGFEGPFPGFVGMVPGSGHGL